MAQDRRSLLEALKAELSFLENGGYRKDSWRPQFIFEDSPTCLNYKSPKHSKPCSACVLLQLVPPDRNEEEIPCRHIPLNKQGETIDSLYRTGTQEELEAAVAEWLRATIRALELERGERQSG
jgi:hypothetical protein